MNFVTMAIPSSVNKAFSHLKSNSTSAVFEALSEIRKFLAKNESSVEFLREKGVLKDLIHILGKPNGRNMDMALSILGNCCLEEESREEASRYGIVRAVVTVLSSTNRDSILGRACRLISNLALTSSLAVKFHKERVICNLLSIVDIEGTNSLASRQMAVRALRILWGVEAERMSMLGLSVVHKVAMLLRTPPEKKEQRELLKAVMKALAVFTQDCSEKCACQVHAGDTGFQSLLTLCANREMKESAILCLYNLCHVGSSRPVLGNGGAVSFIVKELARLDTFKKDPTDHDIFLVSALCLLCQESVNRAKIRRRGGLAIILSVFRDSPNSSLQASSLHGLTQFIYDELSLQELLKQGMLNILVDKLKNIIKENGCEHEEKQIRKGRSSVSNKRRSSSPVCELFSDISATEARNVLNDESLACDSWKRFRPSSPSYKAVLQEISGTQRYRDRINSLASPVHSVDSAYLSNSPEQPCTSDHTGEWSPGSSRSFCFSPDSSPSSGRLWSTSPVYAHDIPSPPYDAWSSASSPMSQSSVDEDLTDVLYSPVCQDVQSDDEMTCGESKCNTSAVGDHDGDVSVANLDPLGDVIDASESPKSCDMLSPVAPCEPMNEEEKLLLLLSRISHMESAVEDLADKNTLVTLLDYLSLMRRPLPRANRILARIIRAHHYFMQLLVHQFALNVYTRLCIRPHASCIVCDNLFSLGNNLLNKLSVVAETGFGEGELCYHLLKAEDSFRAKLAVSIPYIVRLPRLLRKLLLDCKGLDILQKIVRSYPGVEVGLFNYIPTGLSMLAASLKMNSPKSDGASMDEGNSAMCDLHICDDVRDSMDNATFLLDNGDTVSANKGLLCERSPVFEAMFRGHFRESGEETIHLQDISGKTFSNLMNVMKLGRIPSHLSNTSISSAMELLLVLDRFLLPGTKELSDLIIHQFLHLDTVYDVYINAYRYKGLLEEFDKIRLRTVEYLLTSDMNMHQRTLILTNLLEASSSVQIQNDIFCMLREKLETRNYL